MIDSNCEGEGLNSSLTVGSDRRDLLRISGEISGLARSDRSDQSKSANSTEKVAKTVAAFGSVVRGWLAPFGRIEEQPEKPPRRAANAST